MKKVIVATLMLLAFAGWANADYWQTTVIWTHSVGPNLAHEDVLLDGVLIDAADIISGCTNVLPGDTATCVFKLAQKTGQEISIRSTDDQSNSTTLLVGSVGVGPNPPTGASISSTWVIE